MVLTWFVFVKLRYKRLAATHLHEHEAMGRPSLLPRREVYVVVMSARTVLVGTILLYCVSIAGVARRCDTPSEPMI